MKMGKLVFLNNNRLVTDSLTVAETFGKNHKDVLRDIRNLECSQEFTERNFAPSEYQDSTGRKLPKYLLTQDGFSFLVMGYTGKEAARFKEMYINEFNRMKDELNKPQFALPQTMPEALRMLAAEIEEKEAIKSHNLMLEQRVKEYEPKISYIDTILQSKDTVTITQIAKDYGLSGKALNEILHEEKVQYKMNGQWLLYAKHQDSGYTKSYTLDIIRTDGRRDVKMNTQWTQKGRLFVHDILTKRGILPFMDRKSA
jgi:Rha family phage regulatory protein